MSLTSSSPSLMKGTVSAEALIDSLLAAPPVANITEDIAVGNGPAGEPTAEPVATAKPVGVTPPTTPALPRTTPRSGLRTPTSSKRTPKSTASRTRDTRLPSARNGSVFDRLYKTQTAASKAWTPVRAQVRKYTPTKKSVDLDLQIFNRLHITGTVANTSKRSRVTPKLHRTPDRKRSPGKIYPIRPLHTPARRPASYVYSPRMKPLTKLYFDSKYHPGLGLETVEPIKLGYSFFQAFCEYENGGLDSKQIAREIIVSFFKKDFPSGRHWQLHEPSVEERAGETHSYNVKMSATYDWEDGYRVASATGVVRCIPGDKEVRVLNYIYDLTAST